MEEMKKGLTIPKMQLLQMKKGNIRNPIKLELEYISLHELLLKYPIINREETGSSLRGMMKKKGISIKCVQEYLGLACVQSVYHWLDGKKLPSVDSLYALSQLLQVPMDEMLCGSRDKIQTPWETSFLQRMKTYGTGGLNICLADK